ncbi:MAG: sigma-70 family RNA polymerase sigma factor [Muribaculaceae bacterium]|nr:sigma-70 family RNA polymerase sigma factor [Muribaculaceae bacterium]
MPYEYDNIVHQYYEELKPLFVNYLRKNFTITYDEVMYIYTEVWIAVRENIRRGRVEPGTKWKAYILRMGWNQANNIASRRSSIPSFDDEKFDREDFERKYAEEQAADQSIYEDPELQAILAAELSYVPDPCNKILKLYYFDELSMKEIADTMNYSSANSAKTTKMRCMEKLKARMVSAVRRLGIMD